MYMYLVTFYFYIVLVNTENINDRNDCTVTPTPNSKRGSSGSRLAQRIFGGEKTSITHVPYMAAILEDNWLICGGGILTKWWVLTAAQCIEKIKNKRHVTIRIKSSYFKKDGQTVHVMNMYKHSHYNNVTFEYDIGLIEVLSPFRKRKHYYRELRLSKRSPVPGQELTISGWGETEEGKSLSNVVRWANVTVFDNESCKNISRIKKKPYPSTDFCAGDGIHRKDACKGDIGGPAVKNGNVAVGIISIPGCGGITLVESAYTDIFKALHWIKTTMNENDPSDKFPSVIPV